MQITNLNHDNDDGDDETWWGQLNFVFVFGKYYIPVNY